MYDNRWSNGFYAGNQPKMTKAVKIVVLVAIVGIVLSITFTFVANYEQIGSKRKALNQIQKKLNLEEIKKEIRNLNNSIGQGDNGTSSNQMFMRKKLIDMKTLRHEIGKNILSVNSGIDQLQVMITETKKTVKTLAKENNIRNLDQAINNKTVKDYVVFIQRTKAKVKKMDEVEKHYWNGFHDLKCREDNVQVNIIVDQSIGDEKAKEIIIMIDNTLKEHEALKEKIEIRDRDLIYEPLNDVWKSIMD